MVSLKHPPIVFLTPLYPPDNGGAALACQRLVQQVGRQRGASVEVVVMRLGRERAIKQWQDGSVPVIELYDRGAAELQAAAFGLLQDRAPYAYIHAVYPSRTGFAAVTAARMLGVPSLLAVRGNDLIRDAFRPQLQPGLLFALAHTDVAVGVSKELTRMAEAMGARRAVNIPNGVDAKVFRPMAPDLALKRKLGLAGLGPVIGFVGEAREKKGLLPMLEAFEKVLARAPDARLLLLGGVREKDRPAFESALGWVPVLQGKVILQPWVEQGELSRYYSILDCVWHSSLHDGFPNAVLEAFACGKGVLASGVGGIREIMEGSPMADGLLPPLRSDLLAKRTLELLPKLPERVAPLRGWVEKKYSIDAEVRAYMNLYRGTGS